MGSRREEERNEKIIRGLMKLPPNRKCINCNSLGPQYVCTNFWTFVCMTCSGIHREFTHRVKSVSMSKFTSQEVEALQNGGNQRAREVYLKSWDPHSQRLPSSNNVDRIREFIKSVYVDKQYIAGKTSDKTPSDMQSPKSSEIEARRASSYHSFSQSPPYDYQYEERKNRKQNAMLSRKPGSDRGYVGKFSSFFYSPGHSNHKMSEDRFANEGEGPISRVSNYSISSGGDPFRSERESPNFQKDSGLSSPPLSRDISVEDVRHCTVPRPQRTTSSGSFGSFDSNSMSFKSFNSASLTDVVSESEQNAGTHQDKTTNFQQLQSSENSASSNPLQRPVVSPLVTATATPVDLFQLPSQSTAPSVDLFKQAPPLSMSDPTSSIDFFADFGQQQSAEIPSKTLSDSSAPKNEGWATFESSQPSISTPAIENLTSTKIGIGNVDSSAKFDSFSFPNENMQWPAYQSPSSDKFPQSVSDPWDDRFHNVRPPSVATISQSWSTFEDSLGTFHTEELKEKCEPQLAANMVSPLNKIEDSGGRPAYEGLEECRNPQVSDEQAIQTCVHGQPSGSSLPLHLAAPSYSAHLSMGEAHSHETDYKSVNPFDLPSEASISDFGLSNISHITAGSSYTPSMLPTAADIQSCPDDRKSTNPFDLPFDSTMEQSEMFLDMHSMQAALPDPQLSFIGGDSQQWFPQKVTSYVPATSHGGLAYMAGQPPGTQLP